MAEKILDTLEELEEFSALEFEIESEEQPEMREDIMRILAFSKESFDTLQTNITKKDLAKKHNIDLFRKILLNHLPLDKVEIILHKYYYHLVNFNYEEVQKLSKGIITLDSFRYRRFINRIMAL
jgi:hypothetical protein